MKKVRRFVAALVMMLLVLANMPAAKAQSLGIRELAAEAAGGWHRTYQAHGRSITVDIPVQVPQVDRFPLLHASRMPASAVVPRSAANKWAEIEDGIVFNEDQSFRYDSHSPREKAKLAAKAPTPPARGDTSTITLHFNSLSPDTPYSWGNPATIREAEAMLHEAWARFFPEEEALSLLPRAVTAYSAYRNVDAKTGEFTGEPWADFEPPLLVYFDQVLQGIPLMGYAHSSFSTFAGHRREEPFIFVGAAAVLQEQKSIGLTPFHSAQFQVLKELHPSESDLPLCSLDKVIASYEELIVQGKLRSVSSLRLGYIAWFDSKAAQSFTLNPTWVLEGELYKDPKQAGWTGTGESPHFGMVLVNAQTGDLIDPWNAAVNRAWQAPRVIKWR